MNLADSIATDRHISGDTALSDLRQGRGALVPRSLVRWLEPDEAGTVLDYGCGATAPHVQALTRCGYDVTGYDIGNDELGLIDRSALGRKYNVVLCSNVINVQPSMRAVNEVLGELAEAAGAWGFVIINLPTDPRWHFESGAAGADQLEEKLEKHWGSIGRDDIGSSTPVWWCRKK